MPARSNKDVILALRDIALQTGCKTMPTLGTDDVLFALDWAQGRPVQAATILDTLHKRRSRIGRQPR